jgi:hypothetical protein
MATPPNPSEIGDYAPGILGAIVGSLMAIKEGWRPSLVLLATGLAGAWAFKGWAAVIGQKVDMPETASGFLVGAIFAHALKKILEQLALLELAGPFNGLIQRWLGVNQGGKP